MSHIPPADLLVFLPILSFPPVRIVMSPPLHLNPWLQIFCTLSFLSDSQASIFPLPLSPHLTTVGFWLHLCQQTHFTCDLVVESSGHSFGFDLDWLHCTSSHNWQFFLKAFSILSVEHYTLLGFPMVSVLETFNCLSGISVTHDFTCHKCADHFQVSVSSCGFLPAFQSLESNRLSSVSASWIIHWSFKPAQQGTYTPTPSFCSHSLVSNVTWCFLSSLQPSPHPFT